MNELHMGHTLTSYTNVKTVGIHRDRIMRQDTKEFGDVSTRKPLGNAPTYKNSLCQLSLRAPVEIQQELYP